ncbi:MAG: HAMP domain-containing sensor histidine kinase [Phycisphaerales bacterium]|nr:HAMP domain-containing sensor histidine kinase [Phycisphaerales bacterium]
MNGSRRITWIIFGVCVFAVLEGLGWVTWQMLRLEREEREARAEARQQEAIRLALWRLDAEVTPILAREAARPYFQYRAFYPADRAYTRMWESVEPGEMLHPSPLLGGGGEFVRLYFELSRDGRVTSPEAPTGVMRTVAIGSFVTPESIDRALGLVAQVPRYFDRRFLSLVMSEPLGQRRERSEPIARDAERIDQSSREYMARQGPLENVATPAAAELNRDAGTRALDKSSPSPDDADRAIARIAAEVAGPPIRTEERNIAHGQFLPVWRRAESGRGAGEASTLLGARLDAPAETLADEGSRDRAAGLELFVIRRIRVEDDEQVQGIWFDWPALRERLRSRVTDLLPEADLVPLDARGPDDAPSVGRMMASLPVLLEPGVLRVDAGPAWSATRTTLVVTWLAVLGAIGAIFFVLRAAMALSERRARFVSAVTHELRTPLTTFVMYAQMLADGMVTGEDKKKQYLSTLRGEAQRLTGIVENVLAYARLGRQDARRRARGVTTRVGEVLERVRPGLEARAHESGMTLALSAEPAAAGAMVRAEAESIERILTNLVDNACKYASGGEVARVDLAVSLADRGGRRGVAFVVRDHGPGVSASDLGRIFRPFTRAKGEEDRANPGLGLGLALARGLAESMGGSLRYVGASEHAVGRDAPGAAFELWTPTAQASG